MRSVEEILIGLDQLFDAHKMDQVEDYLLAALKEAKACGEYEAVITIVNEMIGFYRDTSQYEKSLAYCRQILPFMEQLGLKETIHYATTCLNIANACRAAGEWQASLGFYEEVFKTYTAILPKGHELYASYYNNLSLLYQEMGEFEKACQALKKALEIIEGYQDLIKIATTCSNLAGSLMRMGCLEEAEEYLNRSLSIYIKDGEKDFHYGAALSAMGELQFLKGNLSGAHEYYSRALSELEKHVGKTEFYMRTLENIRMVEKAMKESKLQTKTPAKEPGNSLNDEKHNALSYGMKQCVEFYHNQVRPMLEKKFPIYLEKIAVAVVGEGSHCFGYDDYISRDHDFYAGVLLLITKDTYSKIGSYLEAEYIRLEDKGENSNVWVDKRAKNRTGVCIIEEFYKRILGQEKLPQTIEEWLNIEEPLLACAVNGRVLTDPEGIFTEYRNQLLSYYPIQVWKRRLAQQLYHLSQYGQYNYGRMMKRNDLVTAMQCKSFFSDSVMKTLYLLNKVFAPYYKWMYRGLVKLECYGIKEKLEKLSVTPIEHTEENQKLIEEICSILLKKLEENKLIEMIGEDNYAEHYIGQLLGDSLKESKEALVDRLVMLEWKAFDQVKNQGGRADCQDDWPTFSIMRKSQYLTWNEDMLESYIQDFQTAQKKGWNLITEKYGRMMASTDKVEYNRIKNQFPKLPEEKIIIIEEIVKIQVKWMEEFASEYPYMAGSSRAIHSYEDTPYFTSFETYLRGELSTYSDGTLDLYGRFIVSYLQKEKNLTKDIMTNTALLYGYESLEDVEQRMKDSLS